MVRKVRHLIDGPLPNGPLPAHEVVLSPEKRFRKVAVWSMTRSALISAGVKIARTVAAILWSKRSITVKWEQIQAEFHLAVVAEMYAPKSLYRHGFRRAICECSPGMGHRKAN